MFLCPELQHLKCVVRRKVCDDASHAAGQINLIYAHDDWGFVMNCAFQIINQVQGDILDGIDRQPGLLGERMEGHSKTAFPNGVHQPFGGTALFIQKRQFRGDHYSAACAAIAWPGDFQTYRLHLHRRISEHIRSAAMPVHGFVAIRALRQITIGHVGDNDDALVTCTKIDRNNAGKVQQIKHPGRPDRCRGTLGSDRKSRRSGRTLPDGRT